MKKVLLFVFAVCTAFYSQAQLPSGSLAPNFTTTDITGVTHELYDYLSQGYSVVIDVSATWCGPCWNYHETGALETLHEEHGVANGGNVIVMFIEGDPTTTLDQLNGIGSTQGNWVAGVSHIISDDGDVADILEIGYFPTIYTVCPTGIITETGQLSAAQHWNFINTDACLIVPTNDGALLDYLGPQVTCASTEVVVELANLGTNTLTSATINVAGVTPAISFPWTGNLERFDSELVNVGTSTVTGPMVITLSTDDNTANNSVNGSALAPESTTQIRFDLKFDAWPEETSWEIRNENNQLIHSGGPYAGQADYSTLIVDRWLPSTGCYRIVLQDTYGDGMNGSQWGGTNQDGHCYVYSMENGASTLTLLNYNGSYGFDEVVAGANVNTVVSVSEINVASEVKLYPNPASDNATLSYTLTGQSEIRMELVNMLGERVINQYVGNQSAGTYTHQLDLSNVASGLYLMNLSIDGVNSTMRITVSK